MSLATPEKIRTLQRKLYLKAKAEPAFRFYLLYDKIGRADILEHAYALARSNGGAPGVDGESFAAIEAAGLEAWLAGIRKDLALKTYRPLPVRRVMIPKPGGGERPLGIPTIRDRVVQTAAKLVLEPIFEADLDPSAYGYRPRRSGLDAIKEVQALLCSGYTEVVDADLAKIGIPFTDLRGDGSVRGWTAQNILSVGSITHGRSRRWTSGSAATRDAVSISGGCVGRMVSPALTAAWAGSRGRCRMGCCGAGVVVGAHR